MGGQIKSMKEVSKTALDQVEEFIVSYNKQCSKKFKITCTGAEEGDQVSEKRYQGSQERRQEVDPLVRGTHSAVTNPPSD
jgi:hypothetical protein